MTVQDAPETAEQPSVIDTPLSEEDREPAGRSHPLIAAATVVLVALPFARLHLDQRHDGYMFNAALDVARGEVLFRDTSMIYGPISTWVHAVAIELLGERVLSIRLATVAAYGLAAGLFFVVWRRFLPAAWTFLAVGLWFVYADFFREDRPLYAWSSVYLLVFHGLTMYARIRAIEAVGRPSRRWNAAAGAAAAGAVLCRQSTGVLLLMALVVPPLLARNGRRVAAHVSAGFAAVLAAFAAWAVARGAWGDAVEQLVVYPLRWADGMATDHLLRVVGRELVVAVVLVAATWALVRFVGARYEPPDRRAYALGGLALGALAAWTVGSTGQLWGVALATTVGGIAALRRALADRTVSTFDATAVLAAAGLVQLVPVPDISHVWWSVGAGVGVMLVLLRRLASASVPVFAFAVGATVALAVPLVSEGIDTLGGEWVALHDESGVTDGMYVRPGAFTDFEPFIRVLDGIDDDHPILNIGPNSFWESFSRAPNLDAYNETITPWMLEKEPLERRQKYLREARPVVFTVFPAIVAGLTERLDYVVVEQLKVREWEGYEYFLVVPRELAPGSQGDS